MRQTLVFVPLTCHKPNRRSLCDDITFQQVLRKSLWDLVLLLERTIFSWKTELRIFKTYEYVNVKCYQCLTYGKVSYPSLSFSYTGLNFYYLFFLFSLKLNFFQQLPHNFRKADFFYCSDDFILWSLTENLSSREQGLVNECVSVNTASPLPRSADSAQTSRESSVHQTTAWKTQTKKQH